MEAYRDKVLSRAPIQERYGRWLMRPIHILDGRGRRIACGNEWSIRMPVWSRTQYIVLHELAHSITRRKFGLNVAGHGWQYASVYLDLVWFGMGREAHDTLKASFKAHRVRFAEPRKGRVLSPEEKSILAARLAAARLKKAA